MKTQLLKLLQKVLSPIGRWWVMMVWNDIQMSSDEVIQISSNVKRIMTALGYDVNHAADMPVVKVYKDMTVKMPKVMGMACPSAGLILVPNANPEMEVLYHEIAHHHQSAELLGTGSVGVSLTLEQYSELEFEIQAWTVQATYMMLNVRGDQFWDALDMLSKEGPVDLLDLATELDLVNYMESRNVNLQNISQWIQDYILGNTTTADKAKVNVLKDAA